MSQIYNKTALIVGASGLIGKHCLFELLALKEYKEVRVLVRRELPFNLDEAQQAKIKLHIVDFDNIEESCDLFEVDDVFCCLGTTLKQAGSTAAFKVVDYDYCLKVAQLSQKNQVKHFLIVTAVSTNRHSLVYYSKVKGELEYKIKKLYLQRVSIFKPSLLLGKRDDFRASELFVGKLSGVINYILPKKLSAYSAVQGHVVAKAMVALASNVSSNHLVKDKSADTSQALSPVFNNYYYDQIQQLSKDSLSE